jgi:hypothetical protein
MNLRFTNSRNLNMVATRQGFVYPMDSDPTSYAFKIYAKKRLKFGMKSTAYYPSTID